jgi:putative FmdB family regulatory protein
MPTYEYVCDAGHEFELSQGMSEPAIEVCKCGKKCKRLISASSFILKGSGWAKDGYGSGVTGKNKRSSKRPKGNGRL